MAAHDKATRYGRQYAYSPQIPCVPQPMALGIPLPKQGEAAPDRSICQGLAQPVAQTASAGVFQVLSVRQQTCPAVQSAVSSQWIRSVKAGQVLPAPTQ
jgi:hypothetical protein